MVVTPIKYLSGHEEGPSKNDAYASTKAVNVSASGRQWALEWLWSSKEICASKIHIKDLESYDIFLIKLAKMLGYIKIFVV